MKLKLFVWTDFCSDWTDGLAFAIAESEEEAKELVIKERQGLLVHDWGILNVYSLDQKIAKSVSGGS